MRRGFQAWLMFLVLGMVLPLAGTPLHWCLCSQTVATPGTPCCQNCDEAPSPADSPPCDHDDCCVPIQLIPDALPQGELAVPVPPAVSLPTTLALDARPRVISPSCGSTRFPDRGPPPGAARYLWHRSLLL